MLLVFDIPISHLTGSDCLFYLEELIIIFTVIALHKYQSFWIYIIAEDDSKMDRTDHINLYQLCT